MQFLGRNEILTLKLTDERLEEIKEIVANMYEKFDINCVPISAFEIATNETSQGWHYEYVTNLW